MQTISTPLTNALNQGNSLKTLPQVIAEWNHNIQSKLLTGYPQILGTDPGDNPDFFPIASIVLPNRPAAGMPKARVGKARLYSETDKIHYRTVSTRSVYKYWASYDTSATTATGGSFLMPRTVQVATGYNAGVKTNKIVVTFENSWSAPNSLLIKTGNTSGVYTTVATNPAVPTNGRITLYLQNDGSWSTTVNRANTTTLQYLRVDVLGMNKANSHCEIIEVGLRYEKDLTSDTVSIQINKQLADDDRISPVGVIAANTASVVLDNSVNNYDPNNGSSPYAGLINADAEFRLAAGIDTTAFGGSGFEYVQQGVFFVDTWGNTLDNSVTVSMTDHSKFFVGQAVSPFAMRNKYPWEVVQQLLESVGFHNYNVDLDVTKADTKIPFVWFDNTKFVWAVLQDLCRSTQSVAFFDELGVLQFKSRDWLFRSSQTPVHQFNSIAVGSTLPDIVDIQDNFTVQANKVVITYTPTTLSMSKNKIVTNALWQPSDTEVVQSCVLEQPLSSTETDTMYIDHRFAQTFPYAGYVNVEGEIIHYDGKVYKTKVGGTTTYTVCHNADDKIAADLASDASTYAANTFLGRLRNLQRGQMYSKPATHKIDISDWVGRHLKGAGSTLANGHFSEDHLNSMMKVSSPGSATTNLDWYIATRGGVTDNFDSYGTQLRFNPNRTKGSAGLLINLQSDLSSGYFIELSTMDFVAQEDELEHQYEERILKTLRHDQNLTGKKRKTDKQLKAEAAVDKKIIARARQGAYKQVRVYRRFADGSTKPLAASRGYDWTVTPGAWYQIDVARVGTNYQLFINGRFIVTFTDNYASPLTSGKQGVFVNGTTTVDFEYFYCVNNPHDNSHLEDSTFLDKVQGDFYNGWIDREVFYKWDWNIHTWGGGLLSKQVSWVYDDFGPYVHEMKEYTVKFDKPPAWSSDIYIDNPLAEVVNYRGNPFGARFYVANKSRNNFDSGNGVVVIAGEDDSVSVDNPIQRQMLIYGTTINQQPATTKTVDNIPAQHQQTISELDFQSDWIQSEAAATALATWITTHYGYPCDVKTMTNFAMPHLQVSDYVSLNYPQKNILPASNFYHLTGVTLSWETGWNCTTTIRKAVL